MQRIKLEFKKFQVNSSTNIYLVGWYMSDETTIGLKKHRLNCLPSEKIISETETLESYYIYGIRILNKNIDK